ncbi:MAG: hypothetical protein AAGM22_19130 [Acidobacteriota bacterium]
MASGLKGLDGRPAVLEMGRIGVCSLPQQIQRTTVRGEAGFEVAAADGGRR